MEMCDIKNRKFEDKSFREFFDSLLANFNLAEF
jgi:hypothetical protein